MRINSVNNVAFKATLRGDIDKIKRLAVSGGSSKDAVNMAMDYIHTLLPNPNDKVYTYLKKYVNEDKTKESVVRSGIKIVKDGVVIEKNIDPRKVLQKNILYKFVSEIKKLLKGKTTPDEYIAKYSIPKDSWLDEFNDKEIKFLTYSTLF